jgi:NitT/TauT family transport system substrate-binding protein
MLRWTVVVAAFVGFLVAPALHAQAPEKSKVVIGVGGKTLFYYLPLTIAEQKGYFKAEGLDVEIPDFAGGAKAWSSTSTRCLLEFSC